MSQSQQFAGFSVVPWYDCSEWKQVYELIFDETSTSEKKREALNIIYLWKTRMNLLPSGIEGTLCILEALLVNASTLSERQYCTLCASSVMRFLNVCVANRAQVFNFTRTARSNSIPDWIINIRHDFAHSHKLPGIAILKLALDVSFKWLKDTYWIPELGHLNSYSLEDRNLDVIQLACIYVQLIQDYSNDIEVSPSVSDKLECYKVFTKDVPDWEQLMALIVEVINDNCKILEQEHWKNITQHFVESRLFYKYSDTGGKTNLEYKFIANLIICLQNNGALPQLLIALSCVLYDAHELVANKKSVALWMNDIFIGLSRKNHRLQIGDETNLKKGSIQFRRVPHELYNDIINLRHTIFQDTNEITKMCFNSFMSLSESSSTVDSEDFFSLMEKAKFEPVSRLWNESSEQGDVNKHFETKFPDSYYCSYNNSSCDNYVGQQTKGKTGRWKLVKNVNECEIFPLGTVPNVYLE